MIELNTKEDPLKRRRSRKVGKFFTWFFGVTAVLLVLGLLAFVIALPFMSYYEEKEAEKQRQIELEYKILHRRF